MLFRKIKKSGEELPILGLGCMRLLKNPDGKIDENAAVKMIRDSIVAGASYIDSAWTYHDGDNERVVGKALEGEWREKAFLVTKLPSWEVSTREEMDRYLDEQLSRLGTGCLDAYLLHALSKSRWEKLLSFGVVDFLNQAKADGKIRYAGFSFHDDYNAFKGIIDGYDWDLCQIQYNYLDENYQAGKKGLEYAASADLSVIIMEPLRGGLLSENLPAEADFIMESSSFSRNPSAWGLRWVWDHPEVTVVLSGMTSDVQLKENCKTAEDGIPGSLLPEEHETIRKVRDIFNEKIKVPCTGCGYCMPCPSGVNIPECLAQLNNASIFWDIEYARFLYDGLLIESGYASLCAGCGACEEKCPQGIGVMDLLQETADLFGK